MIDRAVGALAKIYQLYLHLDLILLINKIVENSVILSYFIIKNLLV